MYKFIECGYISMSLFFGFGWCIGYVGFLRFYELGCKGGWLECGVFVYGYDCFSYVCF